MTIKSPQNTKTTTKVVPRRNSRYKTKGGDNKVVWWIVGFVVFVAVGYGIRLINKSSDDKDVLQQMHQVVSELPDYNEDSKYYDSLVEKFHGQAFEKSYKIGGKHQSNSLNEKKYLIEITDLMATQAERDGKKQFSDQLKLFNLGIKEAK